MRRIEMDHKAKIAWVMSGETALASFAFEEWGGANKAQMAAETYIDERQEDPWELREKIAALEARIAKADALIDALAPMLDDEPSLDEQRAGRAALAAYREGSDT